MAMHDEDCSLKKPILKRNPCTFCVFIVRIDLDCGCCTLFAGLNIRELQSPGDRMNELTWLKDVLPGKPFVTIVRLKIKERKRSKVNDPYLRLVFEDKSGTLDATLWNPDLERLEEALRQGETFRVEGVGSSYLGNDA